VTIYITRNKKNRGSWRPGWSVNPTRTNSVTKEPFPKAILPFENLLIQGKGITLRTPCYFQNIFI
jgi:hypothetical protein